MISQEILDLALATPTINDSPLPGYDYDRLDYGMTIGIERTPGGRLWACWVGGGDDENGFFLLANSDDEGETWSKPRFVIDPHDDTLPFKRRTLVGALWTDLLGRLWWFFDQCLTHYDGRGGDWYAICENPDADRPVWSEPTRLWHGFTLQKPTVLSNGDWLLPVSLWDRGKIKEPFREEFHELDDLRMAHVFASSDQGATWERRGGVHYPRPSFDEHMFIERRDGTLWMTARTGDNIWESFSADGGHNWTAPQRSTIAHVASRHFIRRLKSGRLLLVKHGATIDTRTEARSHLAAFLSEDDGHTWIGGLMLDERTGVSYPDGFEAPDGTIYISYDRNRAEDGEILLARFNEDDILAGRFESAKARERMLIARPLAIRPQTAA